MKVHMAGELDSIDSIHQLERFFLEEPNLLGLQAFYINYQADLTYKLGVLV